MVGVVEGGRRYMMSIVPLLVSQTGVVSEIFQQLILRETEARIVLVLGGCQVEQFVYVLASQWRVALLGRHWWSHLCEDHHLSILHRHLPSSLLF